MADEMWMNNSRDGLWENGASNTMVWNYESEKYEEHEVMINLMCWEKLFRMLWEEFKKVKEYVGDDDREVDLQREHEEFSNIWTKCSCRLSRVREIFSEGTRWMSGAVVQVKTGVVEQQVAEYQHEGGCMSVQGVRDGVGATTGRDGDHLRWLTR